MGRGRWGRVGLGIDSVGGGRCCEEVYVVSGGRWWGGDGEGEQKGGLGRERCGGRCLVRKGAGKAVGMCGAKGLGRCCLVSLYLGQMRVSAPEFSPPSPVTDSSRTRFVELGRKGADVPACSERCMGLPPST